MMDIGTLFFWIIAAVVAASAIMVVVTQNIVRAAVWLLFTLAGTSILYFQLNADFVGATQLIVYVGGTLVLVVFGVMLTAQGPFVSLRTGPGEWAVATVAGLLFLGVLMASTTGMKSSGTVNPAPSVQELGEGFLGLIEATDKDLKHNRQLTGYPEGIVAPDRSRVAYLLPFEIVSVHLLVVLIGAAYLARAKRRSGGHA
jgi:NADH-quinone oxidoreductase subunit J